MEYLYLVGAVAVIAWAFQVEIKKQREAGKVKDQFLEKLGTLPDYEPSQVLEYNYLYFAVDTDNDVVCYAKAPEWKPVMVAGRDILSVAIDEDGYTVTQFSLPHTSGSAVLGVLPRSAEALLGTRSPQSTSVDVVNKMTLRLEIDDPLHPIIDVPFMISRSRRSDPLYQKASSSARSFSSLITALIKRSSDPAETSSTTGNGDTVLERLTTLSALRADGTLTDDEFFREKSRILGTTHS